MGRRTAPGFGLYDPAPALSVDAKASPLGLDPAEQEAVRLLRTERMMQLRRMANREGDPMPDSPGVMKEAFEVARGAADLHRGVAESERQQRLELQQRVDKEVDAAVEAERRRGSDVLEIVTQFSKATQEMQATMTQQLLQMQAAKQQAEVAALAAKLDALEAAHRRELEIAAQEKARIERERDELAQRPDLYREMAEEIREGRRDGIAARFLGLAQPQPASPDPNTAFQLQLAPKLADEIIETQRSERMLKEQERRKSAERADSMNELVRSIATLARSFAGGAAPEPAQPVNGVPATWAEVETGETGEEAGEA